MSVSAPATYKQPSRKGKKAWRKNVDVTEINEGLGELRKEIIAGGVIVEKPNNQLFSLDLRGDKGIITREFKKQKILKVDEILTSRSAVPAISTRKRYPEDIVTDGVVPPPKKKKRDYISHKELQKLKKIAYGGTEATVAKTHAAELHDPWAVQVTEEVDERFSFLEKEKEIKAPKTLKMAPVSLSATGKALPAVKPPEGGISYNPHFEEWDELLRKEGDREVEAEKKRLKEEAEEKERLARIERAEAEELLKGVKEGEADEEDDVDEAGEEGGPKEAFTKPRAVRKTRVQRNKEKRLKERVLLKARLQQQKRQRQELENLHAIKLRIEAKENARLEALAAAAESAGNPEKAEKIRRRKLGKAQ